MLRIEHEEVDLALDEVVVVVAARGVAAGHTRPGQGRPEVVQIARVAVTAADIVEIVVAKSREELLGSLADVRAVVVTDIGRIVRRAVDVVTDGDHERGAVGGHDVGHVLLVRNR